MRKEGAMLLPFFPSAEVKKMGVLAHPSFHRFLIA